MRAALRGSAGGNVGGTKARYPRSARTTWSRCPMAKSSTSIATYLPSIDPSATDLRFEYHFDRQVLPGHHEHEWFARLRSDRSMWRAALRSEAHGATACLRGSRLTTLTPKDFLRMGSHRESLCFAIQHDTGPNRRFRWSGPGLPSQHRARPKGFEPPTF